jgi:hypothetical protein
MTIISVAEKERIKFRKGGERMKLNGLAFHRGGVRSDYYTTHTQINSDPVSSKNSTLRSFAWISY